MTLLFQLPHNRPATRNRLLGVPDLGQAGPETVGPVDPTALVETYLFQWTPSWL